jgi:hypothetical protein
VKDERYIDEERRTGGDVAATIFKPVSHGSVL